MSTIITIPIEKNEDLAALLADKQPADRLYACGTIKALDENTLTLRIEEVTDKIEDLPKQDEDDEDKDKDEGDTDEEQPDGSTEGETEEAIKLASPGGYVGP